MDDTPDDDMPGAPVTPGTLKFLKVLVTTLTATMIIGIVTIIVLIVIRVPSVVHEVPLPLPGVITLPNGAKASAFTQGGDWYAVVTKSNQILIFNRSDGRLRQTIRIKSR